jgi:hypothetical protein
MSYIHLIWDRGILAKKWIRDTDLPISRMDLTPAETSATGHLVNSGRSAEISRAEKGGLSPIVETREGATHCLDPRDERLPN